MNTIPKEFIEIAKAHGAKRTTMNEATRNGNNNYNATNPKKADFIGVLGEMIAALELMKRGKAFFLNALYDEKALPGADIILKDYKIDVKTTTQKEICIPAYKLEKVESLNITNYWLIQINLNSLTYKQFFYTIEQVKTWPIVERYEKKVYIKTL